MSLKFINLLLRTDPWEEKSQEYGYLKVENKGDDRPLKIKNN